ncbi:MAG: hypothetical protein J6Y60_07195 [Treponema sp.]|nr:hypothetical protein [Treponema sp.]
MKRLKIFLGAAVFAAASMFFISCKDSFISAPSPVSVSDTTRAGAPVGLMATNGRAGCIELSWQSVNGASRYYIYGTDSPTPKESDFKQIEQTEDTFISIKVAPGSTAWYKVAAVDSTYRVGKQSNAVRGSSLAKPEITDLDSSESNDDVIKINVLWYMANSFDDTYRSSITYEIKYTNPSNQSESVYIKANELEENKCVLDNLLPHTEYSYQVLVHNDIYGDTEESISIREETLHRLRPSAPIDLKAEKGGSKNSITIKFKLPEQADVCHTNGAEVSYAGIPLYFKILRREAGSQGSWEIRNDSFQIADYEEGREVSWTDSSIPNSSRGIKYEYKVQSYIDKTKLNHIKTEVFRDPDDKNYTYQETSDVYSYSIDQGWAMAIPTIAVKNYTAVLNGEGDAYSSATADFSFKWNNFLSDSEEENNALSNKYYYHLYSELTPFNGSTGPASHVRTFHTLAEVNAYSKTFALPDERGKYKFTLYISDSQSPSASGLDSAVISQLIVTDNPGKISGLTITGGFKDKFTISWIYDSSYTYTLSYTQKYNGVDEGETYTVNVPSHSNGAITIEDYSYLSGRSDYGVTRTYTLSAEKSTMAPISQTYEPVESLGTPQVNFDPINLAYDSITVSWQKVSGAKRYAIKLEGQSTATDIILPGEDDSNVEEFKIAGDTFYSYTFGPEEVGATYYRSATQSGKPKAVTVTAYSDNANSAGSGSARTMGPANVGLSAEVAQKEKSIDVTWNKTEGASGYVLQRLRYKVVGTDYNQKDEDAPELFYIDASTLAVQTNSGEAISNSEMLVTQSGDKLVLTDTYAAVKDSSTASQREKTQSMIPWGIPIEYTVVPVLSDRDKYQDGKLTSSSLKEGNNFTYTNATEIAKKGSAYGYGLNIRASKSEYSNRIVIEWDRPYPGTNLGTPLRYERIANRATGFTSSDGHTIAGATGTTTSTTFECNTDDKLTNAYEFAVKYTKTGYDQTNPFVPSFMERLADENERDPVSPTEQRNKGYAFHIAEFEARGVDSNGKESFTESVTWSSWNSDIRALGPEDIDGSPAYTIWERNLNNASGWFQVGSMTADGIVSKATDPGWYATTITPSTNCLSLTPTGVTDSTGYNNGLLKVQRDAKHYYMICAQRKVGDKIIYTYRGLDTSDIVYTYRKISAEELAKCITLIIADATNQTAVTEKEGESWCNGASGKYQLYHKSASKTLVFGTGGSNYVHYFYDVPGQRCTDTSNKSNSVKLKSGFTIKFATVEQRSAADGNKIHYFPNTNVTVTHENGRSSYEGTVSFTVGTEGHTGWTVLSDGVTESKTITVTGTQNSGSSITLSGNDTGSMEKIFPFKMFTSLGTHYHCCLNLSNDDIKKLPQYSLENWWKIQGGGKETDEFKEEEE